MVKKKFISPVKQRMKGCLGQLKDLGRRNKNTQKPVIHLAVLTEFASLKKESLS